MKLYIYNNETMDHVATIIGQDNDGCESIASDRYSDTDYYGWTYSPAFGFDGGLNETDDAETIEA